MTTLRILGASLLAIGAAALPAEAGADGAAPSAALQRNAWYLPTADGAARLYVTEVGRGSPVVFLHGGPGNDFQYIVPALAPHLARHRFVLHDDRGSLLSPVAAARRDTLTLATLVADLEQLRAAAGIARMTLFGHSFGSLLALAYVEAHPDRVERLVLTGAFPPRTVMADLVRAMRPRQQALRERAAVAATLRAEGLDRPDAALTPRQRSDRDRITGFASIAAIDLARWRDAIGGGVFYDRQTDSAIGASFPERFDFTPALVAHPVPITVIQGDRDYIDPGASAWTALAAAHPQLPIRVRVIARATHNAWIDDPRGFARALGEGLAARGR